MRDCPASLGFSCLPAWRGEGSSGSGTCLSWWRADGPWFPPLLISGTPPDPPAELPWCLRLRSLLWGELEELRMGVDVLQWQPTDVPGVRTLPLCPETGREGRDSWSIGKNREQSKSSPTGHWGNRHTALVTVAERMTPPEGARSLLPRTWGCVALRAHPGTLPCPALRNILSKTGPAQPPCI